jgi:pseudouridine synthase
VRARLQKLLAAAGVTSRRRAEALVAAGRVRVNGRVAQVGDSADPELDRIELDGRAVQAEPPAFWLLHKPRGVLTTLRDPEGRPTVIELLPPAARRARVFPVGRLDRDTEGLLLLTNDGEVAQALLHPSRGSEREYQVTARGRISQADLGRLAAGVPLDDGPTAPARVSGVRRDPRSDTTRFRLVLREGRKRQIRRALRALGHPVQDLLRVRMGPLALGRLAPGEARALTPDEVRRLRAHARRHGARGEGA